MKNLKCSVAKSLYRNLLLASLIVLFSSTIAIAQYPTILDISVVPANPTSNTDIVLMITHYTFEDCWICVNPTVDISGNDVKITFICPTHFPPCFSTIEQEPVPLGILPAGVYIVNICGQNLNLTNYYTFTVTEPLPNLTCNQLGSLSINGANLDVSGTEIINNGTAYANPSELAYYLSVDTDITSDDILINVENIIGLDEGLSSTINTSIDLNGQNIPEGIYYLGLFVDNGYVVDESDENDNNDCFWLAPQITIDYGPECDRLRDSLALVDFYNKTGGATSWNTKWILSQPMDNWFGVCLNNEGCVETLDLDGGDNCYFQLSPGGNGLSGILPVSIGNLRNLKNIYLTDNPLMVDTIPDTLFTIPFLKRISFDNTRFEGAISPNIQNLDSLILVLIDNNLFTFEDILHIVPFLETISHDYEPQAKVYPDETIFRTVGETFSIDLAFDDTVTTNLYYWYKNGMLLPGMPKMGDNTFSITSLTLSDAGIYTCEISNPHAPELTLLTGNIELIVQSCTVSVSITPDPATTCPGQPIQLDAGPNFTQYQWSNGGNTETISVSTGGVYTVTVTDGNGCTGTDFVEVFVEDTEDPTVVCFSSLTRSIQPNQQVSLLATELDTGSTDNCSTNLQFSFSANVNDQIINYTCADIGEQNVTLWVTDEEGNQAPCLNMTTVTVEDPSGMNCAVNVTTQQAPPYCSGSFGSITATPSGGMQPYSYLWNTGSTANPITNIPAGNYSVTVTDINGLTGTAVAMLMEPPPLSLEIYYTGCYLFESMYSGGTPPLDLEWNTGSTMSTTTITMPGLYSLTVTDDNGCAREESVSISVLNNVAPTAICDANVTLSLAPSQQVQLSAVTLDNGSYDDCSNTLQFSFSDDVNDQTIDYTCADIGEQNVTLWVTDEEGNQSFCSPSTTITIDDPNGYCNAPCPPIIISNAVVNDVNCINGSSGSINISLGNGSQSSTYAWQDDNGTLISNSQDLFNLSAGEYCVTITSCNGDSTLTACYTVDQPKELLVSASSSSPDCIGSSNGSIDLTVSGGTATGPGCNGYSFNWSSGQTTEDLVGMLPGNYGVTVTDCNGCFVTHSIAISSASPLVVSIENVTDISCFGACDGLVEISATGGNGPYQYSLMPTFSWQNNGVFENLCADSYGLTVIDMNGCTETLSVELSDVDAISTNVVTMPATNGCNGSIELSTSGGAPNYFYNWAGPGAFSSNNEDLSNLCPGDYCVTITDALGCTSSICETIDAPLMVDAIPAFVNPACFGTCDGEIMLNFMGGVAPFTYVWSAGNPVGEQPFTELCAGAYSVTINSADGQSVVISATVDGADSPVITTDTLVMDASGPGECDGEISILVGGGFGGYTYNWSPSPGQGQGTSSIADLCSNDYFVTIEDGEGCTTLVGPIELGEGCTDVTQSLLPTLCPGESINVNGEIFDQSNPSGSVTFVGGGPLGCDSIININLSFYDSAIFNLNQAICKGGFIVINGETYDENNPTGTEIISGISINGCDSIVYVNLTMLNPNLEIIQASICEGETYDFNGAILTDEDTYYDTLRSVNGSCDSIWQVLELSVEMINNIAANNDEHLFPINGNETSIPVTENDSLPLNWELILINNSTIAGSISIANNENIRYQLTNPDFIGIDSFQYEICQAACPDVCANATVYVVIDNDCITQALNVSPRGFSPNTSPGINDAFDPLGAAIQNGCPIPMREEIVFMVINRWGEVVFKPDGYELWNHDNDPQLNKLPAATYYYILNIPMPNGDIKNIRKPISIYNK